MPENNYKIENNVKISLKTLRFNHFCTVQFSKFIILCVRKRMIPSSATTGMDAADRPSEISQTEKDEY